MITLLKSIPFNILDKVSPTPQVGTIFCLPVIATQLTWQTIFTGTPSAVSINLEASNDGVNFSILDTSTNLSGESRTLITSFNFIRASVASITPGTVTNITIIIIAQV